VSRHFGQRCVGSVVCVAMVDVTNAGVTKCDWTRLGRDKQKLVLTLSTKTVHAES
jgi:hypothetical protein